MQYTCTLISTSNNSRLKSNNFSSVINKLILTHDTLTPNDFRTSNINITINHHAVKPRAKHHIPLTFKRPQKILEKYKFISFIRV